jgi:tetratricopeptide (TPR) repeat protein
LSGKIDYAQECFISFNNGKYGECWYAAFNYLWGASGEFNETVFDVMYYKGLSSDKLGKRIDSIDALKDFAILLQKYLYSPNIFDKIKIENVMEICSKYYYSGSKVDEMYCRATYCLGLSHFIRKDYDSAIYFFERYLHIIQLVKEIPERENLEYTTIKTLHFKGLSHLRSEQHNDAIISFLSELKQIEARHYATGSYRALFNIGLSYLRLEQHTDALYHFNESLMHLNTELTKPLEKFEVDLIIIKLDDIEYEENDTLRHIAILYGILGKGDKAISLYTRIKDRYHSEIVHQQQILVEDKSTNAKTSIYNNRVWNLYFDIKNNLAMIYAERQELDYADKEIDFVNISSFDEGYIKPHMVDTKGYVCYKRRQYKEAIRYFDKAIEKPTPPEGSKRLYWFHKGNCYLKLKDMKNAILCYNNSKLASRSVDDKYLDILNNKAVAYYNNNEKDQAISEFKDILKIKYDYIPAHHNLLKLSLNVPRYSSFWNYWQDSSAKKYFAGAIIVAIFSIITVTLIAPGILANLTQSGNDQLATENITRIFTVTQNSSGVVTNTTNITNTTKLSNDNNPQNTIDIPVYALISIGILALILLSPIIRSASIGTTSIELTTIDRAPDTSAELEFIEK